MPVRFERDQRQALVGGRAAERKQRAELTYAFHGVIDPHEHEADSFAAVLGIERAQHRAGTVERIGLGGIAREVFPLARHRGKTESIAQHGDGEGAVHLRRRAIEVPPA
jgi:hypothetical protein